MSDTKVKVKIQQGAIGDTKVAEKPMKKSVSKVTKRVGSKKADRIEQSVAASTKSAVEKEVKKKDELFLDVYDTAGRIVKSIELPKQIFGTKVNAMLLAQAVRVYLANQRKGTSSTKTRGEVEGSTRKIYRQKGTGRARHGGIRAPIFVHGGIVFGPKPRDFSLSLPKKMKKAALACALSLKVSENGIKIVTGLEGIAPKTKEMVKVFKQLALDAEKQKVMLVMPENNQTIQRAARNISGVRVTMANQLNTYDVMTYKTILFMHDAIAMLEKHLTKES